MISRADDFLLHQTPEPIRHAATSDRRFYDRYFFTGHACSDELFFLLGLGVYPNLGVIDAFASVRLGDRQYATRGSRELGEDRLDTSDVGGLGVEVVEPLRRLRFTCDAGPDAPVGVALEYRAAIEAFDEPMTLTREYGRAIEHATRIIQTGTYEGTLRVGDQTFEVTPDRWWGGRDRSWGVRSIGFEREPKGIAQAHRASKERPPLWIWSPMQFPSRTVHFNVHERADGERVIDTVRAMPALGGEGGIQELGDAQHDLRFDRESRELIDGAVSFREADGSRTTVTLTPLTQAYLRGGTGYGGPDPWRHGMYMGERWTDSVEFDLTDPALTAKIGPTHVACRMESSTGEVGYGTFETQVFGAYPRYGFES